MMPDVEFSSNDLPLLVEVVSAHQSMLATAHAVKRVEAVAPYPIRGLEDLRPLFDSSEARGGAIPLGPCLVSFEHAKRCLRQEFFPIEDRTELISRLLLTFESERLDEIQCIAQRQARATPALEPKQEA